MAMHAPQCMASTCCQGCTCCSVWGCQTTPCMGGTRYHGSARCTACGSKAAHRVLHWHMYLPCMTLPCRPLHRSVSSCGTMWLPRMMLFAAPCNAVPCMASTCCSAARIALPRAAKRHHGWQTRIGKTAHGALYGAAKRQRAWEAHVAMRAHAEALHGKCHAWQAHVVIGAHIELHVQCPCTASCMQQGPVQSPSSASPMQHSPFSAPLPLGASEVNSLARGFV